MLVNLNDVLQKAREEKYAVGLFNTIDTDMLQGAIEAAEQLRSPIIIGTAEILLPYGELSLIAPSVISAAERASVPVVVHYDHGLTFERCMEALSLGFTSVMFDASSVPFDANAEQTREIVKIAHAFGASVEGEIGHVGEAAAGDELATDAYTTVDEAVSYAEKTGVDALAVAIGTAHGVYKSKPELNLDRLKALRGALGTPLVLHGGSGLSEQNFKNAISNGISKINIFTDLCLAGCDAMKMETEKGSGYLDIRTARVDKFRATVAEKIKLFGSAGKA